jgi:hypothetical protein
MAKKTVGVSLRKPPPPADLVDAFVGNDERTPTSGLHALRTTPANHDVVVTSGSGRAFRELLLYVPQDLAQKLGVHCAEHDRDMSNVVAEAVTKLLEPQVPDVEVEVDVQRAQTPWEKARVRVDGALKQLRARFQPR